MKLQRLRASRAIMKTGSVTRAADAMNLTQPAVSRLISGLEEDVGFVLFARGQGRLLPTSEGELFFQRVEHVLAGVDDLARIAQGIGSHQQGSLVLLCTPQAGNTIFPIAISRFAGRYPNIRVDLHIVQRSEVGHAARATPYDIGFTVVPFDNPQLSIRRTFAIPATAVVPTCHRLATRPSVSIQDFAGEDLVMLTRDNSLRGKLELEFAKARISYHTRMEVSSPIVACKLVAQGMGLAVVDPFSPMMAPAGKIAIVPLDEAIELTYAFFVPEGKPVSRLTDDFMEILMEIVEETRLCCRFCA
jgi:DNA-binding transcriptional LysR family regulator